LKLTGFDIILTMGMEKAGNLLSNAEGGRSCAETFHSFG
jgi:hypothetical protein